MSALKSPGRSMSAVPPVPGAGGAVEPAFAVESPNSDDSSVAVPFDTSSLLSSTPRSTAWSSVRPTTSASIITCDCRMSIEARSASIRASMRALATTMIEFVPSSGVIVRSAERIVIAAPDVGARAPPGAADAPP